MSTVRFTKTPGRGFTMVELMVVIAIIGLLVALLVGGLGPALRRAQDIECQNNLRQIAAAVINYTTDYKGAIPPTKYTGSSGLYWCNFLVRGNYLTADDSHNAAFNVPSPRNNVLRCPVEANLIVTEDSEVKLPAKVQGEDYAQGIARLGSSTFKVDCSYYWNGYAGNTSGMPDTSQNGLTARFPSVIVNPAAAPSDKAKMIHDISEIRQRTVTVMVADGVFFDARAKANRGRIAARHSGDGGDHSSTNIAFYDGHVEAMPRTPGDDKQFATDVIQASTDLEMTGSPIFMLPKR